MKIGADKNALQSDTEPELASTMPMSDRDSDRDRERRDRERQVKERQR